LSEAASRTAAAQVDAGAQIIQVFESSAAALGPDDFEAIALPHLVPVVARARAMGVPVILFAPGAGWALELLARTTGADVMGIDWQTAPDVARAQLSGLPVACQGNFDPAWLYGSPDSIRARTESMIKRFGHRGYIANLGHGVLRDTPVEHVQEFVAAVQAWRPDSGSASATLTRHHAES
jgi:uroporphyrinogen decarboxylase